MKLSNVASDLILHAAGSAAAHTFGEHPLVPLGWRYGVSGDLCMIFITLLATCIFDVHIACHMQNFGMPGGPTMTRTS
jgi:hypothetical protein